METSESQLPFLDILLLKKGTSIITDIYYKQTDTKQYLHFKSSHERHVKTNLPYSLARRICTIISDNNLRHERLNELKEALINRGFPQPLIENGVKRALSCNIEDLRSSKPKQPAQECITFVTTHNPNNPELFPKIINNLDILQQDDKFSKILRNTKIIKSKRQPPNLKKLLTNAKFTDTNAQPKVTKCNKPRCGTCSYIIEGHEIECNGHTIFVKNDITCTSSNVIYLIMCDGCPSSYIGQASNLRNRVTLHRQHIREEQYRHMHVSKHIANCANGKFRIFPFYRIFSNSKAETKLLLDSKEKHFISKFKPVLNSLDKPRV